MPDNQGVLDAEKAAFGSRFRAVVEESPYSQRQIAKQIGVRPATVTAWAKGEALPEPDNVFKLAELLSVSIDWLVLGRDLDREAEAYRRIAKIVLELEGTEKTSPSSGTDGAHPPTPEDQKALERLKAQSDAVDREEGETGDLVA